MMVLDIPIREQITDKRERIFTKEKFVISKAGERFRIRDYDHIFDGKKIGFGTEIVLCYPDGSMRDLGNMYAGHIACFMLDVLHSAKPIKF